jgi:tripartite-type tricarboxylate transporter receptor subunit TctC
MREQGIEATGISNWRVIFGAKGINARHMAFWQDTLASVVTAPAWKQQLADNNLESRFMRGAELAKWLDNEYAATRGVMADLALIKQ